MDNSLITSAYIVPGHPHILLAPESSPGWQALATAYGKLAAEIKASDAELILYFSTRWLSVLGYMFQGDPEPEWSQVDHDFHHLGTMHYKFRVDTEFADLCAAEVGGLGYTTRVVNYKGFPIDTGTIVAQKLLNPDNRLPAAMISCNMYSEKAETTRIGQAAIRALARHGRKAAVVLVTNLSSRYETTWVDPAADRLSSLKDDEWNRKILEILGAGSLEDVAQTAREYGRQANADLGFKGIWWLNGLCGQHNEFKGRVLEYQPVWGTGAALVGLDPQIPIRPTAYDFSSEEGSQAELVTQLNEGGGQAAPSASAAGEAGGGMRSTRAPEPVGAYPHLRRHGDLLYISGMGPRQRGQKTIPGVTRNEQGEAVAHDAAVQTRAVIENLRTVLEEAGSSLDRIVDIQVFLTDMKRYFKSFNEVYASYFSAETGPSRTTVEVGSLPTPIAVEMKVIARA